MLVPLCKMLEIEIHASFFSADWNKNVHLFSYIRNTLRIDGFILGLIFQNLLRSNQTLLAIRQTASN